MESQDLLSWNGSSSGGESSRDQTPHLGVISTLLQPISGIFVVLLVGKLPAHPISPSLSTEPFVRGSGLLPFREECLEFVLWDVTTLGCPSLPSCWPCLDSVKFSVNLGTSAKWRDPVQWEFPVFPVLLGVGPMGAFTGCPKAGHWGWILGPKTVF